MKLNKPGHLFTIFSQNTTWRFFHHLDDRWFDRSNRIRFIETARRRTPTVNFFLDDTILFVAVVNEVPCVDNSLILILQTAILIQLGGFHVVAKSFSSSSSEVRVPVHVFLRGVRHRDWFRFDCLHCDWLDVAALQSDWLMLRYSV